MIQWWHVHNPHLFDEINNDERDAILKRARRQSDEFFLKCLCSVIIIFVALTAIACLIVSR